MTINQGVVLSIIEGLTEYLPISSTGQMIIASSLMGIASDEFTKDFTVIVQFGAILAVLVLYWRRFLVSKEIYVKLFVGFLPAAIIGFLVKKKIDVLLDNVMVVAITQIVGGLILIGVDKWFKNTPPSQEGTPSGSGTIDGLSLKNSFFIGLAQCLAFIPGTSRSAASIVGGLTVGLDRKSAAEYSFLLAVPTLTAATAWKTLKIYKTIQSSQIGILVMGNVIAFAIAAVTIKLFVGYLNRRGFFVFGIYRIIAGALILALLFSGHSLDML